MTLSATDLRRPRIWVDSEIGKSWRAGAAAGWETRLGRTPLAFTAGLEYFRQDGPRLRFTELALEQDLIRFTPYRSRRDLSPDGRWGGLAKLSPTAEVPTVFANLVLGDLHVDVHAWTSKRSAPSEEVASLERAYFDDPTQYEVDRHAWFDARYRIPISRKLDFIPRLYGDTFNYERYSNTSWGNSCVSGAVEACRAHLVGASQWAGAEAQLRYDWIGNGRLVTLLGADGRLRHVSQKSDLSNYDTGEALVSSVGVLDASDRIIGAYVQQVWQPTRPLIFNVGSRVDYDPRFDVVGSPRLAGTYQPWRGSTLKVVFAEAFRAPTWGETSFSAYGSQLPAQDLVPERVRSVESSFEQRIGTHRLMFGAYRSWWKELIELRLLTRSELEIAQQEGRAPLIATSVNQYQNITRIEHYGFNAGYDGDALGHRLRFALNVTAAAARRAYDSLDASAPILVSPHYFGNARVSYEPPGNWPGVALAGQLLGSRAADGLARGFASPPYLPASVQLRATLFGRAPWVQGLSYRLGATWASIDRAPFTIGPNSSGNVGFASQGAATVPDNAIYSPVDTFRVAAGLQYELGR